MDITFLGILFLLLQPCVSLGQAILETTSGLVEGIDTASPWGRLTVFYGVPYAIPPIRENRFKVSQPIRTAEEAKLLQRTRSTADNDLGRTVLRVNTLTHPSACPQVVHGGQDSHPWLTPGGLVTNEDCLKLNVFVPSVPGVGNLGMLPILVVVPGEGVNFADSRGYDVSALTSIGRIIVVTLNYRVGVFGFLSTGNKTLEGNGGISDILSALEWVRLNGNRFGGNTSAITVAGRHSGSMLLVTALTSPRFLTGTNRKEPLAQRLILHGGISTGRWGFEKEPMKSFERLAKDAACHSYTVASKIECLKNIPTKPLLAISMGSEQFWKPVIDNSLILRDPLESIEFGKYPLSVELMIGENSGSGSLCYDLLLTQKSQYLKKIQADSLNVDDLSNLIGKTLKEYFAVNDVGLTAAVLHEYSFTGIPEKSFRETFHHFCGTLFIRNPMELMARYASRFQSSVFRYEFSHHPVSSQHPDWLGAAIGDELPFLFPTTTENMTVDDVHVFQNFTGSWINFIRKGYPAPVSGAWPKFDPQSKKMMVFTNRGMKQDSSRFLDRDVHFWRDAFSPLRTSIESCAIDKFQSRVNLCKKVEVREAYNSTNSFLILLIFLLIVAMFVLGVIALRNWKKG